jgi:hypothetical protein
MSGHSHGGGGGGLVVQLCCFSNFGARWGWLVNRTPRPLCPREWPRTRCIGGWVAPSAGQDRWGNFVATEVRSPDRPALTESLFRLRYPGLSNRNIRAINLFCWTVLGNWKPLIECDVYLFFLQRPEDVKLLVELVVVALWSVVATVPGPSLTMLCWQLRRQRGSNLLKVGEGWVVHIFALSVVVVRLRSKYSWRCQYINARKKLRAWTSISVWNVFRLVLVLCFGVVLRLFEDSICFANWRTRWHASWGLRLGYHDQIGYGRGRRIGFKIERVCGFIFLFFIWWVQRMLKSNWWVSILVNICIVVSTCRISESGCVWLEGMSGMIPGRSQSGTSFAVYHSSSKYLYSLIPSTIEAILPYSK